MRLNFTTLKLHFDAVSVEGLESKLFYQFLNCDFPSKNVKQVFRTISDPFSLISIPAGC